jgi:hypothetical protein
VHRARGDGRAGYEYRFKALIAAIASFAVLFGLSTNVQSFGLFHLEFGELAPMMTLDILVGVAMERSEESLLSILLRDPDDATDRGE